MAEWHGKAACHQHPKLDWDAWFHVNQGRPQGPGIHALAVCQFACPVSAKCFEWFADWTYGPPLNVIAGGGWWDAKGRWHITPVERLPGHNPYRQPPGRLRSKYQASVA